MNRRQIFGLPKLIAQFGLIAFIFRLFTWKYCGTSVNVDQRVRILERYIDQNEKSISEFMKKYEWECELKYHSLRFHKKEQRLCNCVPDTIVKKLLINDTASYSWKALEKKYKNVILHGGRFIPKNCKPFQRVAFVVPFRDRDKHLRMFLNHMHSVLPSQEIEYRFFVIEQDQPQIFNKGTLMNIGYLEISKLYTFDCIIFHDVDLLVEDGRNIYNCYKSPRHIGSHVDKYGYKVFYGGLVGGAISFTPLQFKIVNGYSTGFYGWGGEDDDMQNRHLSLRFRPDVYKRIGVTSTKYQVLRIIEKKLYTKIYANLFVAQENEYRKVKAMCLNNQLDNRIVYLNTTEDCAIECYKDGLCTSFMFKDKCIIYYQLCKKLTFAENTFIYEKKDKLSTIDKEYHKYEGECTLKTFGYQQMNPQECARLCSNDINCLGFSYNFNPKSDYPCFRKASLCTVANIVLRKNDVFRTYVKKFMNIYKSAKGQKFRIRRGDCPEGNIGDRVYPSPSIDECCDKCSQTANCKGFVLYNNKCYMKNIECLNLNPLDGAVFYVLE
ncbi:DgyrCDS1701 [Dimorphilus gyrociliatus]|uniref:DgyrCDS1701 n=1 Tax=Dimorphilus gyrociliatus TaxID=2664684 RepID=A0A7I8VAY7_9ANNE|nr:DgyrCDS1701 [Dimorphilus gyrociliatus]